MENIQTFLTRGEEKGRSFVLKKPDQLRSQKQGNHLTQHTGSSIEFQSYKEYQPGDDIRHIDWGAYAKSDQIIVKRFQKESFPHVDILVDASSSMNLKGTRKAEATISLAALFGMAAQNTYPSSFAWLISDTCQRITNDSKQPSLWKDIHFSHHKNPHILLEQHLPQLRPKSIRVMISDFLWLADPHLIFERLSSNASKLILIQILSKRDLAPPQHGQYKLIESETGRSIEIEMNDITLKTYHAHFDHHQHQWSEAALQKGATFQTIHAESVVTQWDLQAFFTSNILEVR